MFKIHLTLKTGNLYGFECLDFCRLYGLPEQTSISYNTSTTSFGVDEGFARAWFDPTDTVASVSIEVGMLQPGEMEMYIGHANVVRLNKEIGVERAKELFIAGRFREVRRELDQLRQERGGN